MTPRKFNEAADDADARPKSPYSTGRLNTAENLQSCNLKRAHDKYDRLQEKKELADLGIDIGEIDDECS